MRTSREEAEGRRPACPRHPHSSLQEEEEEAWERYGRGSGVLKRLWSKGVL